MYDFIYWAMVKAVPNTLIGVLLPKEILSTLTDEEKAFLKKVLMASLPISERTEGIIIDNHVSTPSVNDIPFEQIRVPTLILQAVDDPREREGGKELAERIPNNEYVALTGGHFLLREKPRVRNEFDEFIE